MKKIIYNSVLCISLAAMTACADDYTEPPMSELKLINEISASIGNNVKLAKGMSVSPEYTVIPEDAQDKALTFVSSNSEVATVNELGEITAVELGEAIINITPENTFDVLENINVSVVPVATAIQANSITADFYAGTSIDLSEPGYVTITPADGYNVFDCESSDESVVKFEDGVLKAIGAGTATITIKTIDGSNLSSSTTVTVLPSIPTETLTFAEGQEFAVNTTAQLEFTATPSNATVEILIWTSSDPTVATVTNEGIVTTKAYGTTTIQVSQADGTVLASTEISVIGGKIDASGSALEAYLNNEKPSNATITMVNGVPHISTNDKVVQFNFGKITLNPTEYPIIAWKISGEVTKLGTEYFGTDIWSEIGKGNIYNNGADNGAPEGEAHYNTSDGNHVFFINLETYKDGAYKGKGAMETDRFYLKLGYNNSVREYDIYWFKSFKSKEELKEYIDNENK